MLQKVLQANQRRLSHRPYALQKVLSSVASLKGHSASIPPFGRGCVQPEPECQGLQATE